MALEEERAAAKRLQAKLSQEVDASKKVQSLRRQELTLQVDALQSQLHAAVAEKQALAETLAQQKRRLAEADKELKRQRDGTAHLEARLQIAEVEREGFLILARQRETQIEADVQRLRCEAEAAETAKAELKESQSRGRKAESEFQIAWLQLEEEKQTTSNLESQLQELQSERDDLQLRVHSLEVEQRSTDCSERRLAAAASERLELLRGLEQEREGSRLLRTQLDLLRSEHERLAAKEESRSELGRQVQDLRQRFQASESENRELSASLECERVDLRHLLSQLEALTKERDEALKQDDLCDILGQQVQEQKEQTTHAEAECEKLRRQLQAEAQGSEDLQQQVQALKRERDSLVAQQALRNLEEKKQAGADKLQDLRRSLSFAEAEREELKLRLEQERCNTNLAGLQLESSRKETADTLGRLRQSEVAEQELQQALADELGSLKSEALEEVWGGTGARWSGSECSSRRTSRGDPLRVSRKSFGSSATLSQAGSPSNRERQERCSFAAVSFSSNSNATWNNLPEESSDTKKSSRKSSKLATNTEGCDEPLNELQDDSDQKPEELVVRSVSPSKFSVDLVGKVKVDLLTAAEEGS